MQDFRTSGPIGQIEETPRPTTELEPPAVELRRVVGTVSAPILDWTALPEDEATIESSDVVLRDLAEPPPGTTAVVEVPWAILRRPSMARTGAAIPLLTGLVLAFTSGNVGLGGACAACIWLASRLGVLARRVPFSFGEGFVGYRPDPAWPQGVQEDDDVHWDWQIGRAPRRDDLGSHAG